MFCNSCGKEVDPSAKFCLSCGAEVGAAAKGSSKSGKALTSYTGKLFAGALDLKDTLTAGFSISLALISVLMFFGILGQTIYIFSIAEDLEYIDRSGQAVFTIILMILLVILTALVAGISVFYLVTLIVQNKNGAMFGKLAGLAAVLSSMLAILIFPLTNAMLYYKSAGQFMHIPAESYAALILGVMVLLFSLTKQTEKK